MHHISKKSLGYGAIWSIINNSLAQFLVLAVFLVTARFVTKDAFGVMAICFVVIELFRQVAIESIGTAITAKHEPTKEDYDASFVSILIISLLGAASVYLMSPIIADFLKDASIENALKLTSLMIVTSGLSRTHEAWLSKHMKFKTLAIRSLFSIVIGGGLGIYLAMQGYGLISLVAQQLTTSITGTLFLWTTTDWRPGFSTNRERVLSLLKDSRHLAITGFTNFANAQSDTFFSSYYLGSAMTGVYNASKRIVQALNAVLSSALGKVALPAFAALKNDPERLNRNFLKAASYTSILTAPLYAGMCVLSYELIRLTLGNQWTEAAPVLSILCVSSYLTTFGQYNQNIFIVCGKAHWQTVLTTLYAITNIILFVLFARHGLMALAGAYTARAVLFFPLSTGGALHLLNIKSLDYIRSVYPSFLAGCGMALAVLYFKTIMDADYFITLAAMVPAGGIVYIGLLYILDKKSVIEIIHFAKDLAKR